jgi:exodeoxyribonuclease V alpha subunit
VGAFAGGSGIALPAHARTASTLDVAFAHDTVTYPGDRLEDLRPAWCLTVHKAQGGEWPVVVLVCDRSHRGMLWRNLVYTAVTRAQRALIVVGQVDALRTAARHDRPSDRRTGLRWRLRVAGQPAPPPPSIGALETSGITDSSGTIDQATPNRPM